jgi:precorrin-6Y C5,15-methyltransferase (decarboxylating)
LYEGKAIVAGNQRIHIIGMGDDGIEGLTSVARNTIETAEVILGPDRLLSAVAHLKALRVTLGGDLDAAVATLKQNEGKRIVVLTGGDPLFYGTARYLCDKVGRDRFDIVPHVSSMQLAFARVRESWDEAYLTNLATQPLDMVVEKVRTAFKAGLFTTDSSTPAAVAKALLDRKIDYFNAYVCEDIGSPKERVTQGSLAEIAAESFSPLNVMILVRKPNVPDRPPAMAGKRLFGNPDELFLQSKPKRGLLTPAEVRSLALSELDLGPTSVVWDVGAGSGSVAIEAAQIASNGSVYAIEMDPEDYSLIATNAERFSITNLTPVLGRAPDAFANLPAPDAVFVGGSGRDISSLCEAAFDKLKPGGRIVANVGSIENLSAVRGAMHARAGDASVWMVNVARGTFQMERMRFESLNPTFVIAAVKPTHR